MLVLKLFLFSAVGFIVLRPPPILQLPQLAYFLFVVLAIGLATSSAAFFLDKFRVPLATIILAWFVFATFIGGTDHEFALQKEELNRPASVGESIVRSDAFYRASTGMDSSTRPVIVVAAGGGGIRQAAWTAQVLAGLTNLWGAEFSGNVQLVSAVSAGSVGALHFLKGYSGKGPPTDDLQRGVRASEASASGDIWWGLTYPDSLRALFTFPIRPLTRTMDRGWALEAAWQQTLEFDSSETLNKWRTDVFNGWRPGVAFNATVVETGKRAVLATYDVPDATTADDAGVIACDRDLLMVTAARLSAAFPYVSPVARPTGGACSTRGHLADGGYWDNSGVVSALEWLQEAAGILQQRDVLVIEIAPAVPDQPPIADRAWVWQLTAPLSGLLSVRTDGQRARKQFEREALRDTWRFWQGQQAGADTRTGHIEFVTIADVPAGKPVKGAKGEVKTSLGWHLSRQERCNIERQWQKRVEDPHDAALSKIESILKARRAGVPDVSIGCGR